MTGVRLDRAAAVVALLAALALTACGADSGAPGPAGPPGPPGEPGPGGPAGPGGGVPVTSADRINVSVTGVSVPAGGGAPVVTLQLVNALDQGLTGLPAANIRFAIAQLTPGRNGGSSAWQSYITRGDGGIPNAQASTETASEGTFTDNSDGTYRYTFARALTEYAGGPDFDAAKTHRVGVEIRTSAGGLTPANIPANNAPFDFVPAGGAPLFNRLIVENRTCNACHDNLVFHGEARFDIDNCAQCHNPASIDGDTGNVIDLTRLVHNIHAARPDYAIVGFGNVLHNWADVAYAQDIRNCGTCHEESNPATPQAANWRLVANRASCGTCHFDDGNAGSGDDHDIEAGQHPGGLLFTDDTQCIDCHGPNATVTGSDGRPVRVPEAHEIPERAAGMRFRFNILSISGTARGEFPEVRFSITDPTADDAPYDIHNDAPFTQCAGGASRISVNIAWDTSDYTNRDSGRPPALPVMINPLNACGGGSVDNGDGTFTVTSATAIPPTASGSLAAVIEGHPALDADGDGTIERIAVTNVLEYAPITDAMAVARRDIVDVGKCADCHSQLSVHGSNRTDTPEACATCHNPNMTDAAQRTAGPCLAELGADDQPLDFKVMMHAIHASGATGQPFGVCGFGNSAHVFDVQYPGRLDNCEGCHTPGTYYPVDTAQVLGTTVDVNSPSDVTDDVVISPNTAICSTCHIEPLAIEHMRQNGGDFNAGKAADSTLISSGVETCVICHGPGRVADVRDVHGIGDFRFND